MKHTHAVTTHHYHDVSTTCLRCGSDWWHITAPWHTACDLLPRLVSWRLHESEVTNIHQQLFNAVADRNVAAIRSLLKLGADPNFCCYDRSVFLNALFAFCEIGMIQELIQAGARMTSYPLIAVVPGSKPRHVSLVEFISSYYPLLLSLCVEHGLGWYDDGDESYRGDWLISPFVKGSHIGEVNQSCILALVECGYRPNAHHSNGNGNKNNEDDNNGNDSSSSSNNNKSNGNEIVSNASTKTQVIGRDVSFRWSVFQPCLHLGPRGTVDETQLRISVRTDFSSRWSIVDARRSAAMHSTTFDMVDMVRVRHLGIRFSDEWVRVGTHRLVYKPDFIHHPTLPEALTRQIQTIILAHQRKYNEMMEQLLHWLPLPVVLVDVVANYRGRLPVS